MRRFQDAGGRLWDAVLSRESWGTLFALFVPAGIGHESPVRRALLESASYDEAQRTLEGLTEDELLALFARSEPGESPGR